MRYGNIIKDRVTREKHIEICKKRLVIKDNKKERLRRNY